MRTSFPTRNSTSGNSNFTPAVASALPISSSHPFYPGLDLMSHSIQLLEEDPTSLNTAAILNQTLTPSPIPLASFAGSGSGSGSASASADISLAPNEYNRTNDKYGRFPLEKGDTMDKAQCSYHVNQYQLQLDNQGEGLFRYQPSLGVTYPQSAGVYLSKEPSEEYAECKLVSNVVSFPEMNIDCTSAERIALRSIAGCLSTNDESWYRLAGNPDRTQQL